MINTEQIKTYKERLKALYWYLDIEKKRMLIEDEEGLTHDPNFWDDPKKAEIVLKNIRSKKIWVDAYELVETAITDLDVIYEFRREGEASEDEVSVQDMVSNSKDFGGKLWKNQQRSRVFDSREQLLQACKDEGVTFICPVLYQSGYFYNNGDIVKCSYPGAREAGVNAISLASEPK